MSDTDTEIAKQKHREIVSIYDTVPNRKCFLRDWCVKNGYDVEYIIHNGLPKGLKL